MIVTNYTATVGMSFPNDHVDSPYSYTITDAQGLTVASAEVHSEGISFDVQLEHGTYTAHVTKNGVTVSSQFVVAPPVILQVPVSITVAVTL